MNLIELVGEHLLDAVDFSNEKIKDWGDSFQDAQMMRFRLDGIVYSAIEDPDDGYRSMLGGLIVGEHPMTNVFTPVRVIGRMRLKTPESNEDCETLELVDALTEKIVLEVGTDYTSDYYPAFVANFNPAAMILNAGFASGEGTP